MTLREKIYQACLHATGVIYYELLTHELRQTHGLTVELSCSRDLMALNDVLAAAALAALPRYMAEQPVSMAVVFKTMKR